MIKIAKHPVGESSVVYVVENPPPDFDLCLTRARLECEGRNHKFSGGIYKGLTVKDAVLKDGRNAVFEIYTYIEKAYEPDMVNSLKEALKYFVKADRILYSLNDVIYLKELFTKEIEEYQKRYSMNIEAEIDSLDADTKNKIRDYILY